MARVVIVLAPNQENGAPLKGLDQFEERVAPALGELAKTLERLGRLKALGRQAELLHPGDIEKQLQETLALCNQAREQAVAARTLFGRFALVSDEAGQAQWEKAFLKQCRELKLTVDGEFPTYRIFPIEIRVDLGHAQVLVNKRVVRTLHPKAVAARAAREIERLNRERFNPNQFMRALLRAYKLLGDEMRVAGRRKEAAKKQPLKRIHEVLALRTGPGGYSLSQFAFDLFRLRRDSNLIIDGQRLVFDSTREAADGVETNLPGLRTEALGALEVVPVGSDYDGQ